MRVPRPLILAAIFMAGLACVYYWSDTLFSSSVKSDREACIKTMRSWGSPQDDPREREKTIQTLCKDQ